MALVSTGFLFLLVFGLAQFGANEAAELSTRTPGEPVRAPYDAFGLGEIAPNIILLFTDDQYWDSLSFMPYMRDVILPEATQFSNAFATTPLCCPSRASMLTGLYAFHHGVKSNAPPLGGFSLFDDAYTIATALQDASDYVTHYLGKYMNGYGSLNTYVPPGWATWFAFNNLGDTHRYYYDYSINDNGSSTYHGFATTDYSTDVLRDRAVELIMSAGDAPIMMYMSLYAPHEPAIPAERHAGAYASLAPYRPPNFDETDISDKPAWLTKLPEWEYDAIDALRRNQLETLLAADEALEAIVTALETTGKRDNTVLIFTSDNGYSWGEHRVVGKWCPYEACLRIPLVIWQPGQPAGQVNDSLVLNIDLAPTIADLAGNNSVRSYDGLSLMPLLDGSTSSLREEFLFEQWQNMSTDHWSRIVTTYVGLRTVEWKYVEYATGELELYDLVDDPFELENVANQPQYADIQAYLAERVQQIRSGIAPPSTQETYFPVIRR